MNCTADNLYIQPECNKQLILKETAERAAAATTDTETDPQAPELYPTLDDPFFNVKIAQKKEFNDTQYDGTIHADIKQQADLLATADFELQPHQAFVKNFLSANTPYNGLLLMHGVGTGKTCSAIGVTEEVRATMRELGQAKKIIIVASENVQENFKLQLFDPRKLKFTGGQWTTKSCLGNKLLQEINPTNIKGLTQEKIAAMIGTIIKTYYTFMGYGQFANYVRRIITGRERDQGAAQQPPKYDEIEVSPAAAAALRREFEGRMIVIDEVHNIRKSDEGDNKKVAVFLETLVTHVHGMKLLFLSATPMFNSHKEIIWLLNILNMNDQRAKIRVSDIYEADGAFKPEGKNLLQQKAAGYISYVRGENPYTFPYRVYPEKFAPNHTFKVVRYPAYQMNGRRIPEADQRRILDLYLNFMPACAGCGACQSCNYRYIIEYMRNNLLTHLTVDFEEMDKFGYSVLQVPNEALIISYPTPRSDEVAAALEQIGKQPTATATTKKATRGGARVIMADDTDADADPDDVTETDTDTSPLFENTRPDNPLFTVPPSALVGKHGLESVMNKIILPAATGAAAAAPVPLFQYQYKKETIAEHGRIFAFDKIGKYSVKMHTILDYIRRSEGVILIYSQYIEGGIIPMALALEEMGFIRYSEKSGGADNIMYRGGADDPASVDVRTLGTHGAKAAHADRGQLMPARYAMITGNPRLSPDNAFDIKGLTGENNKDGHVVKVVMVSVAAAEGIDLKFIRQVHILNPWYNMNRIEQIVGRAVRNFSHKDLPFEKRNTEILMHGTIIPDAIDETADLYMYRIAEAKAIPIGRTARELQKGAVDCILNHEQTNFTQEKIAAAMKAPVTQELASGVVLRDFKIGDAPFSSVCNYMETCAYACTPTARINIKNLNMDTYGENFIYSNAEKIGARIRQLMREGFFYHKADFIAAIQGGTSAPTKYPLVQIYATLTTFINDRSMTVADKYGRTGYLQNIGDYYLFLPAELAASGAYADLFDRARPVDYKHPKVAFQMGDAGIGATVAATAVAVPEYKMPRASLKTGKSLYDRFQNFYMIAAHEATHGKITDVIATAAGAAVEDETWYRVCGKMIQYILTDPMFAAAPFAAHITKDALLQYLTDHMLDSIAIYEEKAAILKYVYSAAAPAVGSQTSFAWYVRQYFARQVVDVAISGRRGAAAVKRPTIMLYNYAGNRPVFLYHVGGAGAVASDNATTPWEEYTADDIIEHGIINKMRDHLARREEYNPIVGFMGYIAKTDILVFKVINLSTKRDVGYICMQAGKKKVMDMLNETLGDGVEYFTKDNTKQVRDGTGKIVQMLMNPGDLCIIQELMLRMFHANEYMGRGWFIGPEAALFGEIYKIFTK
jgi:hypothetical protein